VLAAATLSLTVMAVLAGPAQADGSPAPVVTAVSPSNGPTAGGTAVTITGTGLTGATAIIFGGNDATGLSCGSDTSCTATSPAGTAGTVDVQVITPGGTSATSSADSYTYLPNATATITGPTTALPVGTPFDYTITFTNNFDSPGSFALGFAALLGAPATITAVADSAGDACTISQETATCAINSGIAEGSTLTMTIAVTPAAAGTITAKASAGVFFPIVNASTTTTITGPSLAASITGPTTPVLAGTPYTYTETVTNQADATGDATNLTTGPTLNPGATDTGTATITTATASQGSCSLTNTTSAACALGTLAPGASATVTITVLPATPGTVSIADTPSADGVGVFATPSDTTTVQVEAPTVTSLHPASGPLAAGTVVTITGTNLFAATSVTFGAGHPATAVSCTATSCTVTAPAGTVGTVDVRVTTAGGTSATNTGDRFTYVAAPVVTKVSPTAGPLTAGTRVKITGTGLSGATSVTFGPGHPATAVSCTATACTVRAPAGIPGTVDVQVTTIGGTSATTSGDRYTYTASADLASTSTRPADPTRPITFPVPSGYAEAQSRVAPR
jgi:hypothetical protein